MRILILKISAICAIFCLILQHNAFSATISSSSTEVEYEYKFKFRSLAKTKDIKKTNAQELALIHAEHLFGIFHSPEFSEQYGFPSELNEGFAGSKHPKVRNAKVIVEPNDPYLWVEYTGFSKMLLMNQVYESFFNASKANSGKPSEQPIENEEKTVEVEFPLLVDLTKIYSDDMEQYKDSSLKKCTDKHYSGAEDFDYFYNPYRCPHLALPPYAKNATFKLRLITENRSKEDSLVPFKEISSDNENGKIVSLYFVHGFDVMPKAGSPLSRIGRDNGYKLYKSLEKTLLKDYGFERMASKKELLDFLGDESENLKLYSEVSLNHETQRRYFSTYAKRLNGKIWIVRSALFDTTNKVRSQPLVSFPKFWKEAWENGDFIYFGGHSGDGASLSLDSMLKNLEKGDLDDIQPSPSKTQIVFLDACSSYAHYQDLYKEKKRGNLHLMTYGVVSLYSAANATETKILETMLTQKSNLTWLQTLKEIEMVQLRPHINFLYSEFNETKKNSFYTEYLEKEQYPSFMLNVLVP